MVKHRRRLCLATALAGLVLSARGAGAHPEISPQLVNRYFALVVVDSRVEVFSSYLFGPLPGADRRRSIDADQDGLISEIEMTEEARRWAARASELYTLAIDGQDTAAPATATVELGSDRSTGAAAVVIELRAQVPVVRGPHTLRIEPGHDPGRLGETELGIDPGPGWILVASHLGRAAPPAEGQVSKTRFKFDGPRVSLLEDRSATFLVRPAPREPTPSHRGVPGWLLGGALGAALVGSLAVVLRRRRLPRAGA